IWGFSMGIAIGNALGTTSASGNFVQGNLIGTDVTGTAVIGVNSYGVGAFNVNSFIGGSAAGAGNVIAGATFGSGVSIQGGKGTDVQGNFIDPHPARPRHPRNTIIGVGLTPHNCVIGRRDPGHEATIPL